MAKTFIKETSEKTGKVLAAKPVKRFVDNKEVFSVGYTLAGELMVKAFEQAAVDLNCPIPITGEYMLGKNWGDCH